MNTPIPSVPVVPGYTLDRPLGAGGGGRVWAGVRDRDRAAVAVKIVDGDRPDRLRDTLGALDVDHLVRVQETVPLAHHRTALILDLLPGGTLRTVLAARGTLSPGECVTVLTPVAGALGHLHRAGVVHGDLSPDNILFDLRGRPHLSDLGASHCVGDVRQDVLGTDGFVAPEVLLGSDPQPPADVYGLAAVGWFCLTGTEPDLAPVRGALAEALASAGVDRGVPGDLVVALEAALAPEANARPDADTFAVQVFDSAPPEPLLLVSDADATAGLTRRIRSAVGAAAVPETQHWRGRRRRSQPPSPSRKPRRSHARNARRSRRMPWAGVVIALGFLVALAASLLVLSGHAGFLTPAAAAPLPVGDAPTTASPAVAPASPAPSTSPSSSAPAQRRRLTEADLIPLLQSLSTLRAAAWSDLDSTAWADLVIPDSPAARADEADRQALRARHQHAEGLTLTARSAAWIGSAPQWGGSTDPTEVHVRAVVDVTAYTLVGPTERTAAPAAAGAAVEMVLRWDGTRWRVWEVRDAG